ncbi:ATP-binding protein [Pseudoduganella sp. GCM10020061]|uniref:ATP-binding protein n=1 Tax=Pseudoduganella sp. GCM10020061 TaxID=3317345 RepID=UPI003641E2F0
MFGTPEPMATPQRADLRNCADEPIHIPGAIQPHGALLFFTAGGALEGWSANAPQLLGAALQPGQELPELALPGEATALVRECLDTMTEGENPPALTKIQLDGVSFDVVVHAHMGRAIAEFEVADAADADAMFAVRAHTSIERLRRQKNIQDLLDTAVRQVREFTGFDRVMAYRFRSDDSGDVVAEARRDDLTPYLGQRYPAGDIPPQARRMYILNTLRLIADVNYQAIPLLGLPGAAPLDMSFAVLRSVSPIHIEYLQNMGVGASMSVSIVINGRLWGLIACHHMSPKRVPHSIRMAADVVAQVIASMVQSIEARQQAELVESAATVRSALVESLLLEEDPLDALSKNAGAMLACTRSQAMIASQHGRVICMGIEQAAAEAVVASLPSEASDLVLRQCAADWPEAMRAQLGKWAGMLGMPFDPPSGGWCVLMRVEQIEQVAWAGRPEKTDRHGPMGERLTPRGSFEAWHETVRGCCTPWEEGIIGNVRTTLGELARVSNTRRAQNETMRAQLLAMLGHDLRDPLHSINMAGIVLEHTGDDASKGALGRRIQSSSNRMQRLISQVLDMSRIEQGVALGAALERIDLGGLIDDLMEESKLAYPDTLYQFENGDRPHFENGVCPHLPSGPAAVMGDRGRLGQVIGNLLSNARHHGEQGKPIEVSLTAAQGQATISIANAAAPIPDQIAATLFRPFKQTSLNNPLNRTGLGLGLFIAHQIVQEHKGTLAYAYRDGKVVFTVTLPLA